MTAPADMAVTYLVLGRENGFLFKKSEIRSTKLEIMTKILEAISKLGFSVEIKASPRINPRA
jgi:hypothetical protein